MKNKLILILLIIVFGTGVSHAQDSEKYYMNKTISYDFEDATSRLKAALKDQGFGTITEIEMHEKLAEKDFEIKPYRILGVCNPGYAYKTLQAEENIGLFLPCKVLVKYVDDTTTEIVMVNPSVLMKMLGNKDLMKVADEVTLGFKTALDAL